jgi:hypothetical protein
MTRTHILRLLAAFLWFLANVSQGQSLRYEVEAKWPKELPNNWILGHVEQIAIDAKDHIWVLHWTGSLNTDDLGASQNPPLSVCCKAAPAVMEFSPSGEVLRAWGGPGYVQDWPAVVHAFAVDKQGNVWIGGNWADQLFTRPTNPPKEQLRWDRHVLKFSGDGKLLLEIGHPSEAAINNQDVGILGAPAAIEIDDDANEVYIADGYLNKRVIVYDATSGVFKRGWGAYGIPLSEIDNKTLPAYDKAAPFYDPTGPAPTQFRGPVVGIKISKDGMVYVCDRTSNRIQVFTKQGKFLKELFVARETLGQGSVMALAFSPDAQQKYLFVGDGSNNVIWILNRRDGSVVSSFGHRGHNAGQFDYLDAVAVDSKNNLYTGEVKYNNRLQKFIPVHTRNHP